MADEKGLKLDMEGLEKIRNAPPSEAKKKKSNALTLDANATAHLQKEGVVSTDDEPKFTASKPCTGKVVALWTGKEFVQSLEGGGAKGGTAVGVVLDRTTFYA